MAETIIMIGVGLTIVVAMVAAGVAIHTAGTVRQINRTVATTHGLVMKMQALLKTKSATNAVAENAEMIYQDLLQCLIPVMAAIDVMPRATAEHPLWRALGGIMDEYGKNPFTLEKMRRAIKLNAEVARSVDKYVSAADRLLHHISTTEPDGILAATFTDGLLGQSLTFFAQARSLATAHNDNNAGANAAVI